MDIRDITRKAARKQRMEAAAREKIKTYKGEWYTVNSIFGNDWAIFFALLGGREAGKSYSAMKHGVKNKLRKGENFKFYWFRLTDAAADNLLESGGDKLIDPDIKRKYGIKTCRKGKTICTYTPKIVVDKNGVEKEYKKDIKEFCTVLSCSTFYNTKGVGYFDNEYKGEYYLVLDEMNREKSERNTFDIVYNFVNLVENIVRSTKTKIKVILIGNTLEEASDILSAFNYIPDGFGRFKLKSKRCVIDYIKPNEEYIARRKGTIADILAGDASTFTNELQIDRSLIVGKRSRTRPQRVIKFTKTKDTWFTVWNDNIISEYNGEKKPVIAMRRYIDELYVDELFNAVLQQFDARAFKFTSLSCLKRFQKNLKLLKPQK